MFGQNKLEKQKTVDKDGGFVFAVQEVFTTIQGEGPLTGMPAVFVRMRGCNLRCHFCDTDFESGTITATVDEMVEMILSRLNPGMIVVFTGGEPLLQPIGLVIRNLRIHAIPVQIETAGIIWDDTITDDIASQISIVCSPKTGRVHPNIEKWCDDYKYIVSEGDADEDDGLPITSTQSEGVPLRLYRPSFMSDAEIWVQPREEYIASTTIAMPDRPHLPIRPLRSELQTRRNVDHAVDICMRYGYRLSLQLHKILGLP